MVLKKALITGVTGQDGAYLAELLLSKGYEVHGIKRKASLFNTDRIDHLYQDPHEENIHFKIHYGDLTDSFSIMSLLYKIQPDEVYNLGAMSHVKVSFEMPEYTANVDALGALRLLEAIRILDLTKKTKFYQASTSELYGGMQGVPQNEKTPFYPRSPYAVAKLYSYWLTVNYREAYTIFASNGVLFNHESPIRGETFVTRKITKAACKIIQGCQKTLFVGNLNAERDWGHAKDYVRSMWMILQHHKPDDFVIATGVSTKVRDFIIKVFGCLGLDIKFEGNGLNEVGIVIKVNRPNRFIQSGDVIIRVDPHYFRPTEVDVLCGDASKARHDLGWEPQFSLDDLIVEMVQSDMELVKNEIAAGKLNKRVS